MTYLNAAAWRVKPSRYRAPSAMGRVILCGSLVPALLIGSLATVSQGTEATREPAPRATDPALVEFVRTVVPANPRVRAARAALNAGGAFQSAAANPLYNPEFEFDAERVDTENRRSLGVSQTIDWVSKRSARTAVATADRLALEADYVFTRRTVATELLSGLAAYQTGLERETLAAKRVRLMREFATRTKRRFETGDMARVELNLAILVFANARMQQATVQTQRINAQQRVNNLIPSNVKARWPTLDAHLPALPTPGDLESLVTALPEVRAAQRRVDSANAGIVLRQRQRVLDPTLSLSGGDEAGEQLLGLNLVLPLALRNPFRYEVLAAREQYKQAQQGAKDVLLRARARLVSAFERYQIAHNVWGDWEQIGKASLQEQGNQLRRLWATGELSATEFIVQTSQTIDSQDSALELRQALWFAWFEWLAVSGQVDQWFGADSLTKRDVPPN